MSAGKEASMDAKPYSVDLRKGVVAAIEGGMSRNKQPSSLGSLSAPRLAVDAAGGADRQRCSRPDGCRRFQGTTRPGYRSGSEPAIAPCAGSLPSLPGAA